MNCAKFFRLGCIIRRVTGFISVLLAAVSCSSSLLDAPIVPTSGAAQAAVTESATVAAPGNVSATHGSLRSITVSWDGVPGADYYYIYAASSPFDTFSQIAEVNGTTFQYVHSIAAGSTLYFRVCALGVNKTISEMSETVSGSSLAVPVVSYIEPCSGSEDSAVTVYWWMANCSAATYQSVVSYELVCMTDDGTVVQTVDGIDGSVQQSTVTGLKPNTRYLYQVTATVVSSGEAAVSESCTPIDAETAHRLMPEAPQNVTATCGTSVSGVTLTWTLPPFTDTTVAAGQYERRPLYFKIYRKTDSSDYAELVSYFGSIDSIADGSAGKLSFASAVLSQQVPEGAEISETYTGYVPGCLVTWTDSTARRGVVYTYKVVSFVDDINRAVSSQMSFTEKDGWLLAVPSFAVNPVTYTDTADGTAHTSAALTFSFALDEKGAAGQYVYALNEHIEPLNDGSGSGEIIASEDTESFACFRSCEEFALYVRDIPLPQKRGKYSYSVSISTYSGDTANPAGELIEKVTSPVERYVTEEITPLIVHGFAVKDGFKDKVQISWTMFEGVTYTLYTSPTGLADTWEKDNSVSSIPFDVNNPDVIYEKPLEIGSTLWVKMTPSIQTKNGITSDALECKTLGIVTTPRIIRSYDKVTITFDKVQKADKYQYAYSYTGDNANELNTRACINVLEDTIDEATEDDEITKEITINGSENADMAGLPIQVTITAINDATGDKTLCDVATSVVGSAGVHAAAAKRAAADGITLTWNKDKDAAGYVILRRLYNNVITNPGETPKWGACFAYYVKQDASEVKGGGDFVTASLQNDVFTLNDISTKGRLGTGFDENRLKEQNMMAWGVEAQYLVVPVLENIDDVPNSQEVDISDCVTLDVGGTALSCGAFSKAAVSGRALGYGRNVTASKGWQPDKLKNADTADSTSIYVTWTAPALDNGSFIVYRREQKTPGAWTPISSAVHTLYYNDTSAAAGTAYEYCIGIIPETGTSSNPTNDDAFIAACDAVYEPDSYNMVNEKRYAGFMLPACELTDMKREATYTEEIKWTATGAEKRNEEDGSFRGVSGYVIELLNLNVSDKWKIVAQYAFGENGFEKANTYTRTIDNKDNQLAVLRDYKHYYRVRPYVERDGLITYGKEPDYTWSDGHETPQVKWNARLITDSEFAKAALLVFSDGFWRFNNGGGFTGDMQNNDYGAISGSFGGWGITNYSCTYSITAYKPPLKIPSSYTVTPFAITASGTMKRHSGAGSTKTLPVSFSSVPIAVSLNDTAGMENLAQYYTGTVTMQCDSYTNVSVSVTRNEATSAVVKNGDVTTAEQRRLWLPIKFHDEADLTGSDWYMKDSAYGWWPAEE